MRQRILCIISFFAFMFLAVTHAQAQDIRNSSGSYMGKIESSGRVYNSSGSYSGRLRIKPILQASVLRIPSSQVVYAQTVSPQERQGRDNHTIAVVFVISDFRFMICNSFSLAKRMWQR